MRRFVEGDYRRWLEGLRDAETLLPSDSEYRRELSRIRDTIEDMQREYRRRSLPPKYDLFLDHVANPLVDTAENLRTEIERILKKKEFAITDDSMIPSKYRKRVADYFRALSESEG